MGRLEVRGLSKRFGSVEALRAVDLSVEPGEFFTLLGPSGCGKTTLLRTLAGFERQDAGTVHLGERSLDALPAHRRNTGLVFQNYALFPHMTVAENVAFGLEQRGLERGAIGAKVAKALARVELGELGERTPDQLSGGQQQRVGIARALVIEPDLLLMDEPLSNLDAKLRGSLRDQIRSLQQELQLTTLYVTHDQEEALALSDRIAILDRGRVRQVGTPWEVYAQPADRFVASFVGRLSFLEPETLAVRPEAVQLAPLEGEPPAGARAGVVVRRAFLGPVAAYTLDCGGKPLLAEQHHPAGSALFELGATVTVQIADESLLRFDAQGRRVP